MDAHGMPETLAEAKRMIVQLRQQNHAHARRRDRELAELVRMRDRREYEMNEAMKLVENHPIPWCRSARCQGHQAQLGGNYHHWWHHAPYRDRVLLIAAVHEGLTIQKADPLRYRLRFVRYHWRCIIADILARDLEGLRIDYHVHMVRYARANR